MRQLGPIRTSFSFSSGPVLPQRHSGQKCLIWLKKGLGARPFRFRGKRERDRAFSLPQVHDERLHDQCGSWSWVFPIYQEASNRGRDPRKIVRSSLAGHLVLILTLAVDTVDSRNARFANSYRRYPEIKCMLAMFTTSPNTLSYNIQ